MKKVISCLALAAVLSSPAWGHGFAPPPPPPETPVAPPSPLVLGPQVGFAVSRPVPLRGGTTPQFSPRAHATARTIRDELAVRWTSQFPAPMRGEGYERANLSIDDSLRRDVQDGGWIRRDAPSLVLSYDPTNEQHLRIVRGIEVHPRLRVAARLFNCFRVDARLLTDVERKVRVRAYDREGRLVGALSEDISGPETWRLAESAFAASTRSKLAQVLPEVETLLGAVAISDHQIRALEHALVCPSCGKSRDDALSNLTQWQRRRDDAQARLDRIVQSD